MLDYSRFLNMVSDFNDGENLTLKYGSSLETVEIAYELQSGEYTRNSVRDFETQNLFFLEVADYISQAIGNLNDCLSLLDVGTGEGNSLIGILRHLPIDCSFLAIDISWSRLNWAMANFLEAEKSVIVAVADANNIPLVNNAVDIILTVHALEPNGGQEENLLREFARVAKKYVILIEPDYENGNSDQKYRMEKLGYVRNLRRYIQELPFNVILDKKISNNLHLENGVAINGASIIILEKISIDPTISSVPNFCSPFGQESLKNFGSGNRTNNGLYFPSLLGIPFLRKDDCLFTLAPKSQLDKV